MIIAEVGQNWGGDLRLAGTLIKEAVANGADMVKFQLYDTDKVYKGKPCYHTYAKMAELTQVQWEYLVSIAANENIPIFASVFDADKVQWCEDVDVPMYKIASRMRDKDLIHAVRATGKPVIVSRDPNRIDSSLQGIIDTFPRLSLLYCVSSYPALPSQVDFPDFGAGFWHGGVAFYSGFSDHTLGIEMSLCALARGAMIIEKHFTLDKYALGFDNLWSMTSDELAKLVKYQSNLKIVYGDSRDWITNNR